MLILKSLESMVMPMRKKDIAYSEFSKRLRMAAIEKGISEYGLTTQIAKIAEVNPSSAGKWLHGEAMPGRAHGVILAHEFDVSFDWLMAGQGKSKNSDEVIDKELLAFIIRTVTEILEHRGEEMSPEELGDRISKLYAYFVTEQQKPHTNKNTTGNRDIERLLSLIT